MFHSINTQSFFRGHQYLSILCLSMICIIGMSIFFSVNADAQDPTLAEKVFEKYQTLLLREDILAIFPVVLEEIKKPENQQLLTPETILLVLANPDILKAQIPNIDDKFITLLKEDEDVRTMLRDEDFQALLQDIDAINELATLLEQNQQSLAERIFERYKDFFQREDVKSNLQEVLTAVKDPEIQPLLIPATIQAVADNPDLLKRFLPDIPDTFITLLKEDAEVKAFINDTDVHLLLQNPAAIDELAALLAVEQPIHVIVRIVPSSVESPRVGEQLVITIDIADAKDVSGYQAVLEFDPTALKFVSLTHGTYLSGQLLPVETKVENNQISFAQISIDTAATAANGTLVTIIFEVISAKASKLTLSEVIIGALGGVSFPVTVENAEILEPPRKPWDVNGDGRVNILDLTYVASHFGSDNAPPEADVNGDGKVNILDLTLVASHFGEEA